MLSGDNGILQQTTNAKQRTEEAQKDENIIIQSYEDELAKYENVGEGEVLGNYGLSPDETYFIGIKSSSTWTDDETGETGEDIYNTQRNNITADGKGYRFETGHFLRVDNYEYYDYETGDNVTGTVYLCWDANYGTIKNLNDLNNYAETSGRIVKWDIFSVSGKFIGYDGAGIG